MTHGAHLVLVTRELGLPWVELVYGVALSVKQEQEWPHNSAGLALGVI